MSLTNPDDVVLDDANQTVFLTKKGMELDLGGIAKGYIADRIRDLWRAYDVRAGIINLGGNVLFVNSSPKRASGEWILGVQDPKKKRGDNLTTATVHECSAVTSGTYERFLEINGKKYHHIIDPKTGYPVQTHVAGVTLFTRDSVQAENVNDYFLLVDRFQDGKMIRPVAMVQYLCTMMIQLKELAYKKRFGNFRIFF